MTWAIFYNQADLAPLADGMNRLQLGGSGVSNADRNTFRTMWNAGLSGWQTAPIAPANRQEGDPDTRILICTSGTLAQFIALIRKYAVNPWGLPFLLALADDMSRPSGGKDPWP